MGLRMMATENDVDQVQPIRPTQLSFELPTSPDLKVHVQVSSLDKCLMVLISGGKGAGPADGGSSLGSLIYAIPDRLNPEGMPISTALYSRTSSMDFITRLAKVLARRLKKPVYVGGDIRLGSMEDEALALKGAAIVITTALDI